jgi:hypothetical protein
MTFNIYRFPSQNVETANGTITAAGHHTILVLVVVKFEPSKSVPASVVCDSGPLATPTSCRNAVVPLVSTTLTTILNTPGSSYT